MSRIDDLIAKHCPVGVRTQPLSQLASYVRGVTYGKNDEQEDGPLRVLRSNNITLASNTLNFDDVKHVSSSVRVRDNQRLYANDILISAASGSKSHVGKVAFIPKDLSGIVFGGFMGVLRTNGALEPRFLFHLLIGRSFSEHLDRTLSTTTINNLNASIMGSFVVPVPPLEVQREIVRILDQFTQLEMELEAELKAEVEARRCQYEHYRGALLGFASDVERIPLSEVCEAISAGGDLPLRFIKGQTAPSDEFPFPIFSNGTGDAALYGFTDSYRIDKEAVTISARGTIGFHAVRAQKFTPIVRLLTLVPNPKLMSVQFLNYALDATEIGHSGGSIPQLTVPAVKKILVPVPSLLEQERIVAILNKFDPLVNDLSIGLSAELAARRKQYEYYRDRLLTFEKAVA